jgi:hypothetical protein
VQLDLVRVARKDEQLAVAVLGARHLRVPMLGEEEDAIRLAPESGERVEDKERMAERRAVGRIEAVCKVAPIGHVLGRRWTRRRVQDPADEEEAEQVVGVAAAEAKGR